MNIFNKYGIFQDLIIECLKLKNILDLRNNNPITQMEPENPSSADSGAEF